MCIRDRLHSGLSCCFSCHLRCKWRGLTRALEAYGTSGLPGNYIALRIRDGNDRVIESGFDVRSANSNVLTFRTLDAVSYTHLHQLAIVFDNLDFPIETAYLTVVALGVEFGIHDVIVDKLHYTNNSLQVVLHVGNLYV